LIITNFQSEEQRRYLKIYEYMKILCVNNQVIQAHYTYQDINEEDTWDKGEKKINIEILSNSFLKRKEEKKIERQNTLRAYIIITNC